MKKILAFLTLLPLLYICVSCSGNRKYDIEKEQLFTLNLGKMENELDFIEIDDSPFRKRTSIYMSSGLIYVASGNSNKIMKISSYGDLISMIYNPDDNPPPILLTNSAEETALSNRRAVPFQFSEIGEFAVTSDQTYVVEDRVGKNRIEYDAELGIHLDRVVRLFDRSGNHLHYLGQEGIGGKPFPFIKDIVINESDDIIIVSVVPEEWIMYWFTRNGDLRYTLHLPFENLPAPPVEELISSLEIITPDLSEPLVYAKIDYYNPLPNRSDGSFFGSYIYWLDIESGEYKGFIEVPKTVRQDFVPGIGREGGSTDFYHLLGVVKGGLFFLVSQRDNDQNQIIILDRFGKTVERFSIFIDEEEILYRDLYLTPEGVLAGLFCREYDVDFAWWRFDKYIQVKRNESDR